MKFRCANDIFGYCADKPQGGRALNSHKYTDLAGKTVRYDYESFVCQNNPKGCPFYKTAGQVYPKSKLKQLVKA